MSLSVVIPTLNAGRFLPQSLAALGEVEDLVIVDGGSVDETVEFARSRGARIVTAPTGRGSQLIAGEREASGQWLLFLHADTVLETGWREEAESFMADPAHADMAATFRFTLDGACEEARRLERWVAWRTRWLALPYGDQGLLIRTAFYRALGGYRSWPLMEDVDLVRRIGRRRLVALHSAACTSAERWRRGGWKRRSLKNLGCLMLYFLGTSPKLIARLYP